VATYFDDIYLMDDNNKSRNLIPPFATRHVDHDGTTRLKCTTRGSPNPFSTSRVPNSDKNTILFKIKMSDSVHETSDKLMKMGSDLFLAQVDVKRKETGHYTDNFDIHGILKNL
jgi:hypothetical protein